MFRIVATSVRGGGEVPVTGEFVTPEAVKAHVVREFRGISSYWQVFVLNSDQERVLRGYRAGPGGTGERWAWEFVR